MEYFYIRSGGVYKYGQYHLHSPYALNHSTNNARVPTLQEAVKVESILWSINLVALVYLCFWAIRQDKKDQQDAPTKTDS